LVKAKKAVLALLVVLAAVTAGYLGLARAADQGEPGSVQDPLVTKSFVENYVREMLGSTGSGDFRWRIKSIPAGQDFLGGEGTEFIVRTGSARVVDPTGNGIPDLTAGANVNDGSAAALNHLFLIPRADGRGIRAQSPVIIMYRGGEGK
jgi:hypothetical protein